MKPSRELFWNKCDPEDLEWTSRNHREVHEAGGAPTPLGAPSPIVAQPTYFFLLYILIYPKNIQEHHETLFPPLQPSVPKRSHLGAFSGAPPKGASITEGLYINSMAPPMMCEQFTSDLWVHSQQLDGFFFFSLSLSLFGSQYKVLLDSLGDLFDVIFFCGVFVEIR